MEDYFHSLLVKTPDVHGKPKDRFSYIRKVTKAAALPKAEDADLRYSYGMRWNETPDGRLGRRVAFVVPGSPAARAGLKRGAEVVEVISLTTDRLYYAPVGSELVLSVRDTPSSTPRQVTLRAERVREKPVAEVRTGEFGGRQVGYLAFHSYNVPGAQDDLLRAIAGLKNRNINELVLDLRYNGGGYLYQAWSLSSMLAGAHGQGKTFAHLKLNDKRRNEEVRAPFVTQLAQAPDGSAYPAGTPLPLLNLPRVYVLTQPGTCSASELTINALRGAGMNVVLIGATTCGKPYSFTERGNCDKVMAAIEGQLVNHLGFGDYQNGFAPTCTARDDLDHPLGDLNEGMLATALHHMQTGRCLNKQAGAEADAAPAKAWGLQSNLPSPLIRSDELRQLQQQLQQNTAP